jgi:hypothetical protein
VLQEWSFSYGRYTEPTLLIYGQESHSASIYRHPSTAGIDWRGDFPRSVVAAVPGRHGDWAKRGDSISCLAKILREQTRSGQSVPLIEENEHRHLAAKLARRRVEAKEMLEELTMRQAEVKKLRAELQSSEAMLANFKVSRSWRVTSPLRALSISLGRWRGPKTPTS